MGSTIKAGTMTVTIKEDINLNGVARGAVNTLSIPNVAQVSRRIVECPADESTVVIDPHPSSQGLDTFHDTDVRYARITNLDSSVVCQLQVYTADGNISYRLDPGASHFWIVPGASGLDVYNDITGGNAPGFVTVNRIDVEPLGNKASVEVYVASAAAS